MRIPALLAALCLLAVAGPAAAAEAIGSVTRIEGEARGKLNGNDVTIRFGAEILLDEQLTTGAGARLEVTFVDGTKLTVGEKATLTVDRFLYRPRGLGNAFNAVVTGPFRFVSGKLGKTAASSAQVQTAFATIGIRGTNFWGGPIDGHSGVVLLSGAVTVGNSAGSVELTRPGQGTDIAGPAAPPGAVKIWPREKVARALATVTFR
jgi:hypothetical protein